MALPGRIRRMGGLALAIVLGASGTAMALTAHAIAQGNSSQQVQEVVATLATGRATIISGRDGMVVATIGNSFEPSSLPPLIVPLYNGDIAIVLGADDWVEPAPANKTLLRLDQQLPGLIHGGMAASAPSLRPETTAPHLEQLGLAVLEPLRSAAGYLHEQVRLPENLPLAELVLARQTENEPLAVWDVSFWIHQTFWQENFWATEVQRPRFMQLYPTKGDKSGTVQVSYPPGDTSPGLLAWLSNPTGPLLQTIQTDPKLAAAQKEIASGNSKKVQMAELVPLVKAAMETMAPASEVKEMAAEGLKSGFTWVIQPPVATVPAPARPSGAPSLANP